MARLIVLLLLVVTGCGIDEQPATTPAAGVLDGAGLTGELRLSVAAPLSEVARSQAQWFEQAYPGARIVLVDTTARGALVALQRGDVDAALLDRAPSAPERRALHGAGLQTTEALVGAGAVVFVTSGSRDSLRVRDLRPGTVDLVVPSRNSGVTGTLADTLGRAFRPAVIVRTDSDVLAAVARWPDRVGIVSQPSADSLPAGVRVLPLSGVAGAMPPRARHVFRGDYPLVQRLTLVSVRREDTPAGQAALRAGFARFVVGTRGQEAVVRAGWAPATLPERPVVLSPSR